MHNDNNLDNTNTTSLTNNVSQNNTPKSDKPRNEYKPEDWEWPEIHDPRKRAALITLRITGNMTRAARAAKVARKTVYEWMEWYPEFKEAVEEVRASWVEGIEEEAYRRAVEGVTEPVGWYKGEPGGYVQKYSDSLMAVLLKGNLPEKYADRVELKGALANLDLTKLPDHLVERIAAGEHPLSVLASAQDETQKLLTPPENGVGSSDIDEAE